MRVINWWNEVNTAEVGEVIAEVLFVVVVVSLAVF